MSQDIHPTWLHYDRSIHSNRAAIERMLAERNVPAAERFRVEGHLRFYPDSPTRPVTG